MSGQSPKKDLKQIAVEEIIKETSRAAARAEVGGSLSWTKPRHRGINKRFLNNTMLSTVIQNTKTSKDTSALQSCHQDKPSKPVKTNPHVTVKEQTKPKQILPIKTKPSSKMMISSRSRYNSYLDSYKKQKLVNKLSDSQADAQGSQVSDIKKSQEHVKSDNQEEAKSDNLYKAESDKIDKEDIIEKPDNIEKADSENIEKTKSDIIEKTDSNNIRKADITI